MNLKSFEKALKYALNEVATDLAEQAVDRYGKEGRGAFCFRFTHEENESKFRLHIGYVSGFKTSHYKYLPKVIEEYDPKSEFVIIAILDDHEIVRRLSFNDPLGWDTDSEE